MGSNPTPRTTEQHTEVNLVPLEFGFCKEEIENLPLNCLFPLTFILNFQNAPYLNVPKVRLTFMGNCCSSWINFGVSSAI